MSETEIDREKYIVCCPMCDNDKCCRGTDKCDAGIWAEGKRQQAGRRSDTMQQA
jgi:hypothetical protein